MNFPSRIKSSLALTEIEFPSHKPDELFDILKDKVEFSFRSNSISRESIRITSLMAEGDARVGLEILRRAGKKAEDRNLRKVTIEEIEQAIKDATRFKTSYFASKLNEYQKTIYEILGKKKRMASGLLYREYCRIVKIPVVDRAYRNYMNRMVELGIVNVQEFGRWKIYEIII